MSRLLLDTHAVLWWLNDDTALSEPARALIADPANEPFVSTASVWEIAIKRSLGKLSAPETLPEAIGLSRLSWLGITVEHAWAVRTLPMHHRDPFDRLLVAQALSERVPLISTDDRLDAYGVDRRW
jgi:PIN domain nuclease of toxin-antitoxin system